MRSFPARDLSIGYPKRRRYVVPMALLLTLTLTLALAGCDGQDKTAAQKAAGAPKPQVGVVTLHPQSVAITGELPGARRHR